MAAYLGAQPVAAARPPSHGGLRGGHAGHRGLAAGYGAVEVVRGVDLAVHPGEVVALLGPNGAGKTTTLLTIAGALRRTAGPSRSPAPASPAGGPTPGPPGRGVRPPGPVAVRQLTVAENLRLRHARGAASRPRRPRRRPFPPSAALLDRQAGLLSGGEQRMLALARALARHPRLLLVDELSLGLAPQVVDAVGGVLRAVADGDGAAC